MICWIWKHCMNMHSIENRGNITVRKARFRTIISLILTKILNLKEL